MPDAKLFATRIVLYLLNNNTKLIIESQGYMTSCINTTKTKPLKQQQIPYKETMLTPNINIGH